jgi:hypothetical protein
MPDQSREPQRSVDELQAVIDDAYHRHLDTHGRGTVEQFTRARALAVHAQLDRQDRLDSSRRP